MRRHRLIAIECLRMKRMTRSTKGAAENPGRGLRRTANVNRETPSQNWPLLRSHLQRKPARAGRGLEEANPRHTSQRSSRCRSRNHPSRAATGTSTQGPTSWRPGFSPPERQRGPLGRASLQSRVRERPESALPHVSPFGWIVRELAAPVPSIHEADRGRALRFQDPTA